MNVVPLVRDAAPRSALAEEALEAGRISLMQNQKQLAHSALGDNDGLAGQFYSSLLLISLVVQHGKLMVEEEALEAGRISLMQNQKQLGQELILESLSLHEQIYGILHPEVAKCSNRLRLR
jgi:protein TIF31